MTDCLDISDAAGTVGQVAEPLMPLELTATIPLPYRRRWWYGTST